MRKQKNYIYDGWFLCEKTTGCERYAYEMMKQLDGLLMDERMKVTLFTPVDVMLPLKNIEIVKSRYEKKKLFRIACQLYALRHHAKIINLVHQIYPLQHRVVAAVHDIREKVTHGNNLANRRRKVIQRIRLFIMCKFSFHIITVSGTEKQNMMKHYHLPADKITIIHSAWDHVKSLPCDEDIFISNSFLEPGKYYYATATLAQSKNFGWIIEVARRNPDSQFVITGRTDTFQFFGIKEFDNGGLPNVHHLGYVSDGELAALMKHCKAFLFPSLYEGFGLPPLEALGLGAGAAIVSNAACLPEIYGGKDGSLPSVHFINPYHYEVDLDELLAEPVALREELLSRYTWEKSAKQFYELLLRL